MPLDFHRCVYEVIEGSSDSSRKAEQEVLINKFFSKYKSDGIKPAIDYLYSTNKWMMGSGLSETGGVDKKLDTLVKQLGNFEGYELLRNEKISESLSVCSYLVKYDRQPIRFNFILYRSNEKWRFQVFQFDINIETEMKEITNISWYH